MNARPKGRLPWRKIHISADASRVSLCVRVCERTKLRHALDVCMCCARTTAREPVRARWAPLWMYVCVAQGPLHASLYGWRAPPLSLCLSLATTRAMKRALAEELWCRRRTCPTTLKLLRPLRRRRHPSQRPHAPSRPAGVSFPSSRPPYPRTLSSVMLYQLCRQITTSRCPRQSGASSR
jgi:hypothetical protein